MKKLSNLPHITHPVKVRPDGTRQVSVNLGIRKSDGLVVRNAQ